ncbi:MAG TPA: OsmC family protein [Candidatus Acidoferrales bacterium]|nr:OsmC family protein [Candidatus Acidoferrales bacterium]
MQTATVRWTQGEKFAAETPSGHRLALDSERASNTGPGPMELLLVALGSCTATDIVIILAKKRQRLESLEVTVTGERAPSPPQVWTRLDVVFKVRGKNAEGGPMDEKAVADAVRLSDEKYCSVAAMLRKTAALTMRFEIVG